MRCKCEYITCISVSIYQISYVIFSIYIYSIWSSIQTSTTKFHFRIHLCQRWNYSNVCTVCVCVWVCGNISFQLFWNGLEWIFRIFGTVKLWKYKVIVPKLKHSTLCTISFVSVIIFRTTTLSYTCVILIISTYDLLNNLI